MKTFGEFSIKFTLEELKNKSVMECYNMIVNKIKEEIGDNLREGDTAEEVSRFANHIAIKYSFQLFNCWLRTSKFIFVDFMLRNEVVAIFDIVKTEMYIR